MRESRWQRQLFQTIVQFLIVFFTGMLVFDKVPTSLDQVWQPFVQATLSALSIWAASKASVGGAESERRTTEVRTIIVPESEVQE